MPLAACHTICRIRFSAYAAYTIASTRVDIFYPRNKNFHVQCILQRTRVTSRYQRNRRALERKKILCRGFSTRSRIHSRNHGKKKKRKTREGTKYIFRDRVHFSETSVFSMAAAPATFLQIKWKIDGQTFGRLNK